MTRALGSLRAVCRRPQLQRDCGICCNAAPRQRGCAERCTCCLTFSGGVSRIMVQLGVTALQTLPDPRCPSADCLACRCASRLQPHLVQAYAVVHSPPTVVFVHCAGMSPKCRASASGWCQTTRCAWSSTRLSARMSGVALRTPLSACGRQAKLRQAVGHASPFIHDYMRSSVLHPAVGHVRCGRTMTTPHSGMNMMRFSASRGTLACLQGQDEREQQVRADLAAEKEQLRKHHDRELRTLREQYENSQVPFIIKVLCSVHGEPTQHIACIVGLRGQHLISQVGLKATNLHHPNRLLALCCHISGCLDARCVWPVQCYCGSLSS